jgi:hemoglobin-like flavoprotein
VKDGTRRCIGSRDDRRTVALVQDSWARLSAGDRRLVSRFYEELFRLQPWLAGLFRSDARVQARMFQAALALIVGNRKAPPCEQFYLVMLGRRHAQWNVRRAHFEAGRTALLGVFARGSTSFSTQPVEPRAHRAHALLELSHRNEELSAAPIGWLILATAVTRVGADRRDGSVRLERAEKLQGCPTSTVRRGRGLQQARSRTT